VFERERSGRSGGLAQHDLMAGLGRQEHDDIIAIADHAMDTHGASTGRAGTREHDQPYGVPYRCLLPRDVDNLLVACRGASFSSVAASSCPSIMTRVKAVFFSTVQRPVSASNSSIT